MTDLNHFNVFEKASFFMADFIGFLSYYRSRESSNHDLITMSTYEQECVIYVVMVNFE